MNKKSIIFRKSKVVSFFTVLLGFAAFSAGCSSDNDNITPDGGNNDDGKKVKITVSVQSAIDESDYLSFVSAGGVANADDKTVWKVNGETQNSQAAVSLNRNSFSGNTKTYIIESIKPLDACSVGVQFINFGQDLKFSIKIEVDDKVAVEEANKTLSGDGSDFTKDYTF